MENLNIFIRSIFVDNMIFAYFLGMCSFIAVSKNVKTAFGLGIAVTFMLVVTLPVNYLLENYVLRPGALVWLGEEYATVDLSFLSLIMFIAVIASMTQLVEMAVEKYSPALYSSLGIFLPLIAVNCAILGGSLFMQQRDFPSIWTAVCAGGGWGLGWLSHSGDTRASCRVLQHPPPSPRRRHNIHNHRADGHSVHELPRHKDLNY